MQGINRRRVLIGTGSIATATIAGIAVGSEPASGATITMDAMSLQDAETKGNPDDVVVDLETKAQWDANERPTAAYLYVKAGEPGATTEVKRQEFTVTNQTGTLEETVTTSVLKSASLSKGDFELLTGQSTRSVDVEVGVGIDVVDSGTVLVSDYLSDTATIEVSETEATVSMGVTGTFTIS